MEPEEKNNTGDGLEAKQNEAKPQKLSVGQAILKGLEETLDTFKAFLHAPREILGINLINIFEGMAYFGILTYLMLFMTKNVELSDVHASWVVSGFLMLITLSQLFLGGVSDKVGPKKMLGITIIILLISRIILGSSELLFASSGTGVGSIFFFVVCGSLLCAALAYGVFNPAIYSLTRMYSDKKTSAVSYAMLYAGMNLGAFIIGLLLPIIRRAAGDQTDDAGKVISQGLLPGTNGISGAMIFIAGIMVIVLILYVVFIARSKTKPFMDPKEESEDKPKSNVHLSLLDRIKAHPLADLKFDFFIFILIPVQTLFAYQNILIPSYLERCYTEFPTISGNYETFSNLNPLIVFISAPVIAALTAKQPVYKMMIIGTTVMAIPTFLLCLGTTPATFLTFILIGSIGESMWQPRFLQHVTQIAPKEKIGAYVGIANLPWFMTKFIVGLYVGFFMERFIPDLAKHPEATQMPETMWLIFACIAMISPVALFLARKWMNPNGDKPSDEVPSADEL
ncbi:MAG: MFS transporter [Proteobacteria bacterium]|nr:MFS transporter [Pseudomonadota bacterium]